MGTNTDAILFYGFHHEDGESWEEILGDDWEALLASKSGIVAPTGTFEEQKAEWEEFWRRKYDLRAAEPCEVGDHCSGDYPMSFVCVKDSKINAARGYPEEIKSLDVRPEWDAQLRAFAEKMGLPWQQPRWWIASWWSH
jgi:hypothetical protein